MIRFDAGDLEGPVEQMRMAALDDVVAATEEQTVLYMVPWDAWVIEAQFEGVRMTDVRGIAVTSGGGYREMVITRRGMRASVERMCAVLEGPNEMLPRALLFTYRRSDQALAMDVAFDEQTAARWDVLARGAHVVGAEVDPLKG